MFKINTTVMKIIVYQYVIKFLDNNPVKLLLNRNQRI